jgi:hypothetical protein
MLTAGTQAEREAFTKQGRVPISQLMSDLRAYTRFVTMAETLSTQIETRSPLEFGKYVLTSYVKRMTGEFHDRCESGLIGEALGQQDYSETAHSMWRFRNYALLDGHHSTIVAVGTSLAFPIPLARSDTKQPDSPSPPAAYLPILVSSAIPPFFVPSDSFHASWLSTGAARSWFCSCGS